LIKQVDAPQTFANSVRTIDLSSIFETSADKIVSPTYGVNYTTVYDASFKTSGLTYTATYTEDALTQNIRAYLSSYDVTGQTFELVGKEIRVKNFS
jgi:hypothetical protein